MAKKTKTFNYIDLFSGCGGLSLGLYNAGWKGLFAVEKSPYAFETLKHNLIDKKNHFDWPEWLPRTNHDITSLISEHQDSLIQLRGKVDMVTGGPPCQGFSTAGKRDESDRRNNLVNYYIKFIDLVRPKILFFENVRGFTLGFNKNKGKGEQYSTYVTDKLSELGYSVSGDMIDFSQFGIPQKRCRFILVGVRQDNNIQPDAEIFFEKIIENKQQFLLNKNLGITTSLEEAISDLLKANSEVDSPDTNGFKAGLYKPATSQYQIFLRAQNDDMQIADSHRFVNHKQYITQRFQFILDNCERNKSLSHNVKDLLKLKKRTTVPLKSSEPTPTLTTLPDDYIHYSEPRILTVREYARIQSFPDWYKIKGKYTTGGKQRTQEVPRYTQIGNAIPPLFGEQSGLVLREILNG